MRAAQPYFNIIVAVLLILNESRSLRLEPINTRKSFQRKLWNNCIVPFSLTGAALLGANIANAFPASSYCSCDGTCRCSISLSAHSDDQLLWYNPANERIYNTLHSSYVPALPERYLLNDLKDRNVITIGEIHSNPCHHKVEFEVIRSLSLLRRPETIALGLECFYRQHQPALDRFVYEHGDIALLKRDTDWDNTWGYDLNQYAKIFKFAASHKMRLVGLNVPIEFAKLVNAVGLDQLPNNLRRFLPDMDLGVQKHQRNFLSAIGASAEVDLASSPALYRMYQTQTLWDEYMSESAALFLEMNPLSTLVVIAGLGHVRGRVAIPDRIFRRTKSEPFVIVPQPVKWSKIDGMPTITTPPARSEADWVWYTQDEILQA